MQIAFFINGILLQVWAPVKVMQGTQILADIRYYCLLLCLVVFSILRYFSRNVNRYDLLQCNGIYWDPHIVFHASTFSICIYNHRKGILRMGEVLD